MIGNRRQRAVEKEERRVAATLSDFYRYGGGTGGGSPMYPPDEENDDVNFVPVCLPPHLGVMGPPTDVNINIIQGPNAAADGCYNLWKFGNFIGLF